MEKNLENPKLSRQVKREMAANLRLMVIAKTFLTILFVIASPVLIIFLVDDKSVKIYSLITFAAVFFTMVLFYLVCPLIISKKLQLRYYLKDLDEVITAWRKQKEHHISGLTKCLNQEPLTIEPYPEITRIMQKIFSQSVKLMQNVSGNYEISVKLLIEQYSLLYFQHLDIKHENDLHDLLEKVKESIAKSENERFQAATKFFEACKAEQKKLPTLAANYKTKRVALYQEQVIACQNEIDRVREKKDQALKMLENL